MMEIRDLKNRVFRTRKPRVCPRCKSRKIAKILYGLPHFSEELERKLKEGEIVLGGCVLSYVVDEYGREIEDFPRWKCIECGLEIYKTPPLPSD